MSSASPKQLAAPLPKGWIVFRSGELNQNEKSCANVSDLEHQVKTSQGGNDVEIAPLVRERWKPGRPLPFEFTIQPNSFDSIGSRSWLKVDDGWLVGFDSGEWGGSLWWVDNDGKEQKRIAQKNVHALLHFGNRIIALVGLTHLFMNDGEILRVEKKGQKSWTVEPFVALPSAPEAYLQEEGEKLLISDSDGIIEVKGTGAVKRIVSVDLSYFYPNSIVRLPTGEIFLGMQHFVLRLTPAPDGRYDREWMVPSTCKEFEILHGRCSCNSIIGRF